MSFVLVYVTNRNLKDAEQLANHLPKKRLIACANFLPIKSSYWWKGKITDASEVVSILKTRNENWRKVREEIKKVHPYEVPCIMKLEVEANSEFEDWVNEESKQ
ncbi:MAG: divalent-cation tolerance protein CutA [Candidatus Micrarchaeota archaeon]